APRDALKTRLPEDPAAELEDQSRFFKNRDKCGGRYHAKPCRLPAQERFHPADHVRCQIHLGLVVNLHLVLCQRRTKTHLHFEPLGGYYRHGRIEFQPLSTGSALRVIEGDVYLSLQRFGTGTGPRVADPDTRTQMKLILVDRKRFVERLQQAPCDTLCIFSIRKY